MSVSRRASFAAGIAAQRRQNRQRRAGEDSAGGTTPTSLSPRERRAQAQNHGSSSSLGGNVITVAVAQGSPAAAAAAAAAKTVEAAPGGQDDATRQRLQQLHSCSHSGSQGSGGGGGGKKGASSSVVALEMSGDDPSGGGGGGAPAAAGDTTLGFLAVAKAAASLAQKRPRLQYEVRAFTKESLEKINIRTSNLIRDYGFLPKRAPNLVDGAQLPAKFEPFPSDLLGKPIEELDQYVYEKTFCVVSRRFQKHFVQRFSATRSLCIFAPWNKIRTVGVYLCTNQYFDYVVMLTIGVNCIFLAMTKPIEEAEYVFLAIYSAESVIKSVARGFILNNYSYLRNPWNWLDFTVIASGYLTSFIEMGNLAGLRTFRVLRALKTVSIMPSLKTIINALLNAVKQLAEVMTLTIFCLMVFALFALQVYMGQLRNKCVLEIDMAESATGNWTEWILDSDHWFYNSRGPELCGNASGARSCPGGYVCLPNIGDNPNFGYTSFDNLLWAMLTTFQLITLDFWENVYNMIVATGGPIHVIFFTIVVFFGSFYLINLMLAVVAMSYEEEAEANIAERAKESEEAAANARIYGPREECTIRTNSSPDVKEASAAASATGRPGASGGSKGSAANGAGGVGGSGGEGEASNGKCGKCRLKSGAGAAGSSADSLGGAQPSCSVGGRPGASAAAVSASEDKSFVVIKARQVGGQIQAIEEHQNGAAPAAARNGNGGAGIAGNGVGGGGSGSGNGVHRGGHGHGNGNHSHHPHVHHHHHRSGYKAQFSLTVPINPNSAAAAAAADVPSSSVPAQANPGFLLPPPPAEHANDDRDRESLSNYSSGGESVSRHSSLNDSGVFNDDGIGGGEGDKLRVQLPEEGDVINRRPSRISRINIPFVVSIESSSDRNCPGCRKFCVDYGAWVRFQNVLFTIVHDMLFETCVTIFIILNTLFLAAEHHGMSQELKDVLELGNQVFTSFFALEAALKLMALSKEYFSSGWNIFDLIIVIASLIDLSVESADLPGISVLRGMRLMRVLKLAQSWTTMKVLLSIIISTLGALGNLTFLLLIVIYIFAVLGMQLFGKTYIPENFAPDPVPRWNFTDFFHSFMMIFRILCGEWIEPLWDCMRAEAKVGVAESCLAIFLPALVMGNFMVLNLFLALLLNSFNCEELKSRKEEVKGESGSVVAKKWMNFKEKFTRKKKKEQPNKPLSAADKKLHSSNGSLISAKTSLKAGYSESDMERAVSAAGARDESPGLQRRLLQQQRQDSGGGSASGKTPTRPFRDCGLEPGERARSELDIPSICPSKSLTFADTIKEGEDNGAGEEGNSAGEGSDGDKKRVQKKPESCFPPIITNLFSWATCLEGTALKRGWDHWRQVVHDVVDNPFFEWTILLLIFASSLSLCFEDINLQDNEELIFILKIVNMVFAVLFFIEMLLKWVAFGLFRYFTSMWTCLDFLIVCVSILSLAVEDSANLTALRSLRTLRALRPLRAISRWQGMKIVVNALMYAIPSIFNVLLVCLVFWLIFSIMGVQFFGGKFFKCVDESGTRLDIDVVNNKTECFQKNYTWINSKINFDHVGNAYLALFQVATFEGWMEVMADAVDAREVDEQPQWEASIYNYFYFVIFIVCGSFFTLNLFIGVIIDNFNMLKKRYEGGVLEMFLTESQKNYYTAMKKLGRKKPQKVIRRPKNELHAVFYDISLSRRFEIAIFVLIFLNMVSMGIEHYNQSRVITFTLEICNALFTTIFALECIVKIIGLRFMYFTAGWNVFDFVLVIASIVGIVMEDMMTDFPVSPTLLRVVRVFRIGRILRLIKAAKGIRKLLFALIVSLPALFNIGALLALITFIYAIIGMTLFGHVKHHGALNDQVNFETFARAMQLLFRLVTSAGWNDVLEPLLVTPPGCDPDYKGLPNGNCGHPFVAMIYFVSFIIINFMIVINMYIAIILENFNQAHQEEEIGIVEEDLEMFYTKWSKYDPYATQFISFHQMSDFIGSLDPPLGIPKPNTLALVSFDLPIAKGDKIHCLDVLHSLTKYTLGFVDDGSEDFSRLLASQMDDKFKKQFPTRKELEIVSSTREWKRLDNASRILQKFFAEIVRARQSGTRINIQTQTTSLLKKPSPLPKSAPAATTVVSNGSDDYDDDDDAAADVADSRAAVHAEQEDAAGDWRLQSHSLPSLGRASSESSIDGGGRADDGYFVAASGSGGGGGGGRPKRERRWMSYRGNERERSSVIMSATDEDQYDDDDDLGMTGEDEGERTHTSGEELDRFSGYSDQPEPYHPPLLQQGPGHQRRRHPAHHQPNPGWDRIPSGYAEEDPEKAIPRSRNLLRSYSEDPPAGALSPAAAHARRQQQGHSSHTSLEAYADAAPSTAAAGLPMRPTDLGRLPHSTSLQALQDNSSAASLFQHYPTHSFPRQQHRRNPSWQHGRSRYLEHTCQDDQQPLNSRDRFLQGIEVEEPLSLPKAPLISPDNPGHSVVQFDQEGNAATTTTTTTRGGYHSDGHGGHGGHGHGHSLQLQKLSPFRHTQDSGYQGSEYVQRMGNQKQSRMPSHEERAPGDDDDNVGYGEETAALLQLQRQYPPEALLSPDPSRRRWAAAADDGGGSKRRHESEASLNLDFETEDQAQQIEMQIRSSDKPKSPRRKRSGDSGGKKGQVKEKEGEEEEGALKYVISEAEFKQQQKRKGESAAVSPPPKQQNRGGRAEGQKELRQHHHHRHHQSEGQQGHRQSIRRQARLPPGSAQSAQLAAVGDVSDAFDDDGLFQFEQQGGGAVAAAAVSVAAPGEDRTDCKRQ